MEQHTGLNAVDLGVIAVILISGALAMWRGLVRELFSLGAWLGAIAITGYFYPVLRPWMLHHIKTEFTADACTALLLFCGSLALLIPIGYLASSLIRGRALTAIDRSLGFVYGLARGGLVVCILFLITLWVWPDAKKGPDMLAEAKSRPFLAQGAEVVKNLLPQDEANKIAQDAHVLGGKIGEEKEKVSEEVAQKTTSEPAQEGPASTVDSAPEVVDYLIKRPQGNQ